MPRLTLERKMDELLRLVSLWEDRHSPLASYSKGMRQKILLMAALLHDPNCSSSMNPSAASTSTPP
jgi:ABC-2 type transport system ATP-binding protein